WTDIYAGATSRINIAPTSQNLDSVGEFLDVFGTGAVAVTLNDQTNPYGQRSGVPTAYFVGDTVSRTVMGPGDNGPSGMDMQFFGLKSLTLNTSTSSPNKVVVDTQTPVTINSGAADTITVDGNALAGGQVTLHAHGGTMHLEDSGLQNDDEDGYTAVYTTYY